MLVGLEQTLGCVMIICSSRGFAFGIVVFCYTDRLSLFFNLLARASTKNL